MYIWFDSLGPSIEVYKHLPLICFVSCVVCFILQSGRQDGGPGKSKQEESKPTPTYNYTEQEPRMIPLDLLHSKLGKNNMYTTARYSND